MTFDPSHKPNRENLDPTSAAMLDRAFYRRRAVGLNVQFRQDDGKLDEWSFKDESSRDAFIRSLKRECVISA